jgi:NCS1 family nucleobase:cation symporter-1
LPGRHIGASGQRECAKTSPVDSFVWIHADRLEQQPDLTRYTKRPKDAGWRQASSIFASKTLIFFFGIGATAAVQGKFGQAYWNQWDLLNAILDRFWGPAARAGCFFAAFGFTLSVVGVNIGCNSIPFGESRYTSKFDTLILMTCPGADVTGLFPRAFNIIRGQLFCGTVSLAIVPWKLLSTFLHQSFSFEHVSRRLTTSQQVARDL